MTIRVFTILRDYNVLLDIDLPGRGGRNGRDSRFHSAAAIKQRLGGIAHEHPEVVVKKLAPIYTPQQGQQAANYITRDGNINALDECGHVLSGKEEVREALEAWRLVDDPALPKYDPTAQVNARLALHFTLSMPVGIPPAKVLEAGRRFALEEFGSGERADDRSYFLVLHTPETEPDPGKHGSDHPHVHLLVKSRNARGERLRTEPEDLERMRRVFAFHLQAQGIQAKATSRIERSLISRDFHVRRTPGRRTNPRAGHALSANPEKSRVLKARAEEARRGELDRPTDAESVVKEKYTVAREELREAFAIAFRDEPTLMEVARVFMASLPALQTDREILVAQVRQQEPPTPEFT